MPNDRQPETAPRRAAGELEKSVLAVLLDADGPLNPGEVRDRLGGEADSELAYTTVVTILSRLYDKGVLTRRRHGRAFRYAPVADEAGLAARRLSALLDGRADREVVLARFVADLSDHDEELLRRLLGDGQPGGA